MSGEYVKSDRGTVIFVIFAQKFHVDNVVNEEGEKESERDDLEHKNYADHLSESGAARESKHGKGWKSEKYAENAVED